MPGFTNADQPSNSVGIAGGVITVASRLRRNEPRRRRRRAPCPVRHRQPGAGASAGPGWPRGGPEQLADGRAEAMVLGKGSSPVTRLPRVAFPGAGRRLHQHRLAEQLGRNSWGGHYGGVPTRPELAGPRVPDGRPSGRTRAQAVAGAGCRRGRPARLTDRRVEAMVLGKGSSLVTSLPLWAFRALVAGFTSAD